MGPTDSEFPLIAFLIGLCVVGIVTAWAVGQMVTTALPLPR